MWQGNKWIHINVVCPCVYVCVHTCYRQESLQFQPVQWCPSRLRHKEWPAFVLRWGTTCMCMKQNTGWSCDSCDIMWAHVRITSLTEYPSSESKGSHDLLSIQVQREVVPEEVAAAAPWRVGKEGGISPHSPQYHDNSVAQSPVEFRDILFSCQATFHIWFTKTSMFNA